MLVLDFSKAFDRIPHQRLLRKLEHFGIRGTIHSWIASFLSGRTQSMVVEGSSSDRVPVVSGVPQGSVLGPMLFLLFINDLQDKITLNSRLFADDCIVYRQIKGILGFDALQEDLNMLAEWETKWGMAFHPQKCSVLSVTRSRTPIRFNYQMKGHILELQDSTKYLGLDLHSSLSWKTHIDVISKEANSMFGVLATQYKVMQRRYQSQPSDQIWSTAHQYGTHTIKIKFTKWKWFRGGQQGLPRIGTEAPVVFPLCWTIFNGSHLKLGEVRFNSPFFIKWSTT